jgi:YnbE-like lipoprotein
MIMRFIGGSHDPRHAMSLAKGCRNPDKDKPMRQTLLVLSAIAAFAGGGCTPTVRVEVPDKPIEINLNINMKIEQNVRFKIERELDRAAVTNPGIF